MDENKLLKALKQINEAIKLHTELFNSVSEEAKKVCEYEKNLDVLTTTKEALEKQLPKKPIEHHYEEEGEKPYIKMTCPNGCRSQPSRSCEYCRECGQRLDWSE